MRRQSLFSLMRRGIAAAALVALLAGAAAAGAYPELDLDPKEALSVSPEGVKAVSPSELSISPEEAAKLRAGNYKVAFTYHTVSDQCNQTKLAAARAMLADWGIETVSVTDAKFKAEGQMSDIESIMALDPDVLFVMPVDPDTAAAALRPVQQTYTKIVFMENVATGFRAGIDYVGSASSDSYGNGKAAADIMAKELGYKGKVAMLFYDMAYFVTTERDRGFKETMAKYYPEIEIVMEAGFTDVNNTGTVADAIFARYPDIDGIYGTWDIPAEGAIATARSLGRDDVIITCCDLGDSAARMIAEGGMVRGTGAPRSYEQGQAEALIAAYALLDKPLPSTFVTPPALPVVRENVLEAYKITYNAEPPKTLLDAYKRGEK
ncbi:MAG: substrate-binding domain-containing protein [Planctomycetes bacterium]|nr:substrate-binding domain-containing protein [Planctomycetota bacterium]